MIAPASSDPTRPLRASPPQTAIQQIHRRALLDRVRQSSAGLVLLVAPAGFGKTTVMQQLRDALQAQGHTTAWLTLERGDNDPQRFLSFLRESLQAETWADEHAPYGLALTHRGPMALFLDEFELVVGGAVPSIVRDLLDQLPRGSRLVMGTRQPPGFGLARWRAQGALIELGPAELQFSADESRDLLQTAQGRTLPAAELAALQERTQGWPAAVAFASLALAQGDAHEDILRRFSGSSQPMTDYLSQVVFERQPPEVREFLLGTALLRQLEVASCSALLPGFDAAFMLERLQTSNVFVTKTSSEPEVWRYHPLFAEFLRERLLQESPGRCQQLHLAASAWYEAQGRLVPAIDHAIGGDDLPHAARLLAGHAWPLLSEGRLQLLSRWFNALPWAERLARPPLASVSLWTTTLSAGAACAERQWQAIRGQWPATEPEAQANVQALQCAWLLMLDRPDEAYAMGMQALAALPTTQAYADSVLAVSMAILMTQRGERDQAHQLLDAVRMRQGDASFMRMYIESAEGEQDMQDGLLRQALARFRIAVGALGHTPNSGNDMARSNAWAGVLYAAASYEEGRLEQAERLLQAYLPIVRSMGMHEHQILSFVILSRIARAQGHTDEASALLRELEAAGEAQGLPRLVASAWLERARVLTHAGDAPAATAALARADLPAVWTHAHPLRRLAHSNLDWTIANLRWTLHFGDAGRALSQIEAELAQSRRTQWRLRGLTLELLRAAALNRLGRRDEALMQMRGVLAFAAEQGFVRRLVDEGGLVLQLALALLQQLEQEEGDPLLMSHLRKLLEAAPTEWRPPDESRATHDKPSHSAERLTPKEMQILALLAEGFSNEAMGEKLSVSTNTIRAHLRSIHSKMAVGSRTQAVAKARQLGWLR